MVVGHMAAALMWLWRLRWWWGGRRFVSSSGCLGCRWNGRWEVLFGRRHFRSVRRGRQQRGRSLEVGGSGSNVSAEVEGRLTWVVYFLGKGHECRSSFCELYHYESFGLLEALSKHFFCYIMILFFIYIIMKFSLLIKKINLATSKA